VLEIVDDPLMVLELSKCGDKVVGIKRNALFIP
jgi:hypothetical protein